MRALPKTPAELLELANGFAGILAALDQAEARPARPAPVPDPEVEARFRALLARTKHVAKPPPQTERQVRLSHLVKGVLRELAHTDVPTEQLTEQLRTVVRVARRADEAAPPAARPDEQHGEAAE